MDKIIVINGRQYYESTGLLVENTETTYRQLTKSESIHSGPQKSKTLNRNFVKRPENLSHSQVQNILQFKRKHDYEEARKKADAMNAAAARARVSNSPRVARFNPGVSSAKRVISPIERKDNAPIAPATNHPMQERVREVATARVAANSTQKLTLREQKNLAISRAIEKTNTNKAQSKSKNISKKYFWQTRKFITSLASATVIVESPIVTSVLAFERITAALILLRLLINLVIESNDP